MDFVEKAREFAEEECNKPTSKYGPDPYKYHFVPVAKFAEKLVDVVGGDKEVILIAVWLHDIGSIIYGRKDHHITGQKVAEEKLREWGYSEDKIKLVKKCIKNHRGSVPSEFTSVEEKIISDTDSMSNFDNIAGIMKVAIVYEGKDQSEVNIAVKEKIQRKWDRLFLPGSREMLKKRYDAVMTLFGNW